MPENLYIPNCIRTVSGRYVNVLDPDPETLDLSDIAHALSHVPRFGGHLPMPWSVLQHSMLVESMVPGRLKLQALLHDASEAFLCDVPSPLKAHLPEYMLIEERMMQAIATRFGFTWPLDPVVKAADTKALELEWEHIMLLKPGAGSQRAAMTRLSRHSPHDAAQAFIELVGYCVPPLFKSRT
jgi:hypothetical protein